MDVVEVHERGPDWIIRDFDPDSMELRVAVRSDPEAQQALDGAIAALEGSSDQALRTLLHRLQRPGGPSANIHWSPDTGRLIVIDMM